MSTAELPDLPVIYAKGNHYEVGRQIVSTMDSQYNVIAPDVLRFFFTKFSEDITVTA